MSSFDYFDLDDSGYDDSYSGIITSITFAPGKYDFQATVTTKHDEPRVKNDGTLSIERSEWIKVGGLDQNYVATDDGTGFTNKDGKKPRKNSAWGRFVTRLQELGVENPIGAYLRWDREGEGNDYSFTDKATGEVKKGKSKGYMIPVENLDADAFGTPLAKTFDFGPLREAGMGAVMESDLAIAAKSSDTLNAFQAKAMEVEGVVGTVAVLNVLGREEFYQALRST